MENIDVVVIGGGDDLPAEAWSQAFAARRTGREGPCRGVTGNGVR
ncbi:hypothetical protein [Streptomyces mirabilis]